MVLDISARYFADFGRRDEVATARPAAAAQETVMSVGCGEVRLITPGCKDDTTTAVLFGRGRPAATHEDTAMALTLICPNLTCGRTIIVPDQARGKVVRCAHCDHPFMVPPRKSAAAAVAKPTDQRNGS